MIFSLLYFIRFVKFGSANAVCVVTRLWVLLCECRLCCGLTFVAAGDFLEERRIGLMSIKHGFRHIVLEDTVYETTLNTIDKR